MATCDVVSNRLQNHNRASTDPSCPNGGRYLPNYYCGRGGRPCPPSMYCEIDATDRWAVCCRIKGVGQCPDVSGQIGICVEACSSNSDCPGEQICCSNGCGHTCQDPVRGREKLPKMLSCRNLILELLLKMLSPQNHTLPPRTTSPHAPYRSVAFAVARLSTVLPNNHTLPHRTTSPHAPHRSVAFAVARLGLVLPNNHTLPQRTTSYHAPYRSVAFAVARLSTVLQQNHTLPPRTTSPHAPHRSVAFAVARLGLVLPNNHTLPQRTTSYHAP
uniref:WAP domain-containing protein n=1 Tax=Branchiostoma floridae TaxID=7739 RepID=C3ZU74_BRAFL|eukprot:XP_002587949.1 hypothetical protein BRAFLDRAFT_87337 [Branchiostoma floridae]